MFKSTSQPHQGNSTQNRGVRQGCILPPLFFINLYGEYVVHVSETLQRIVGNDATNDFNKWKGGVLVGGVCLSNLWPATSMLKRS